jgi:hypothetical protein
MAEELMLNKDSQIDYAKAQAELAAAIAQLAAIAKLRHYLGFCQTPIDPDTLDFHFDTHGLLTSHEIKNH